MQRDKNKRKGINKNQKCGLDESSPYIIQAPTKYLHNINKIDREILTKGTNINNK